MSDQSHRIAGGLIDRSETLEFTASLSATLSKVSTTMPPISWAKARKISDGKTSASLRSSTSRLRP